MDISQVLDNIGTAVRFVRVVRDRPALLSHAETANPPKFLAITLKPHTESFHPPPGSLCAMGPRRRARPKLIIEELEWEGSYLARRRILVEIKNLPRRGLRR
jgi:hypothetical protein